MRSFPVYCALTLTKLYCYDIFSLSDSIFSRLWAEPQPKNAKMSLPVYVRRSVTLPLLARILLFTRFNTCDLMSRNS